MNFLYAKQTSPDQDLTLQEKTAVFYHDIFDFPLTFSEIIKWSVGENVVGVKDNLKIIFHEGYYFLEGRKGNIFKRELRRRISRRKLELAKKAGKILSLIPTIQTVAVTGALAMENAKEESDIDILLITKKGTLWISRLLTYLLLNLAGISIRKPAKKDEEDKLCLNMWLDEEDLVWPRKDQNIYTAHEITQIKPLVDKDRTYEKFIDKNKWVKKFWPNAIKIQNYQKSFVRLPALRRSRPSRQAFYPPSQKTSVVRPWMNAKHFLLRRDFAPDEARGEDTPSLSSRELHLLPFILLEPLARKVQFWYMKKKITREIITPTRAIFHPVDLGKVVLSRF